MISLKGMWVISTWLISFPKTRNIMRTWMMTDDSVMPTDWLEHTEELHSAVDLSNGKDTWEHFFIG